MTTLNIGGVPEHFNLPWHWAAEKGLWDELALNVNWTDFGGGTGAMMTALRNKELDVAIVLTEGAVTDIVRGNDVRIIQTYVNSPLNWGVHVAADSAIQNLDDLQSQRYAISRRGSGSHLMALVHAAQQKRDINESDWVQVGNIEGAEKALTAKEADVFMWEKAMTQPLVDAGIFKRVGIVPTPWPCFVVVARTEIIAKHRDLLKKMMKTVGEMAKQLKNDEKAADLVAQQYGLKTIDVAEWLKNTEWNYIAENKNDYIQPVIDTLFKIGIIDHSPSIASLNEQL